MTGKAYRRYFQHGTASFEEGLTKSKCPYPSGTREHRSWTDGWSFAERQTDEGIRLALQELREGIGMAAGALA